MTTMYTDTRVIMVMALANHKLALNLMMWKAKTMKKKSINPSFFNSKEKSRAEKELDKYHCYPE